MRRSTILLMLTATVVGCAGSNSTGGTTVEVVPDVDYYYACGNEVLELPDGRSFYPLLDQDRVDPALYEQQAAAGTGVMVTAGLVLAVADPGAGDDVGTLTVFDDGIARFESLSGIVAWLSEDEVTYNFVC